MSLVRRARESDGAAFLDLVQELADYEKLAGPTPEARQRLLEDAFGPRPRFDLWVGEDDAGRVVGYAVTFETYGTFAARPYLYLEDLYVTPSARGQGLGRRFLQRLAQDAVERGCARFTWVVLDWNEPARGFYREMGAVEDEGWVTCKLEGEALQRVASGGSGS